MEWADATAQEERVRGPSPRHGPAQRMASQESKQLTGGGRAAATNPSPRGGCRARGCRLAAAAAPQQGQQLAVSDHCFSAGREHPHGKPAEGLDARRLIGCCPPSRCPCCDGPKAAGFVAAAHAAIARLLLQLLLAVLLEQHGAAPAQRRQVILGQQQSVLLATPPPASWQLDQTDPVCPPQLLHLAVSLCAV